MFVKSLGSLLSNLNSSILLPFLQLNLKINFILAFQKNNGQLQNELTSTEIYYSHGHQLFTKGLFTFQKRSNWQPLSSLHVIFSAVTFGSKSVGSSLSTFVLMVCQILCSFKAGVKKPKWKFLLLIALQLQKFPFWFSDSCFKTTQNLANHGN